MKNSNPFEDARKKYVELRKQQRDEVVAKNGIEFVKLFKECVILVNFEWSTSYLRVCKTDVWRFARYNKVRYKIMVSVIPHSKKRMIIY